MKILGLKRLKNTPDGNPRWEVQTDEGFYRTKPDAQVGYTIQNYDGRDVWLTIDGYGYIVAVSEPTH